MVTPMRRLLMAAALVVACGGTDKGGQTTTAGDHDPELGAETEPTPEPAEQTPEEKLVAQQGRTCEAMCERITSCAIEDARANLSEEELAELDLENTGPKNTEQCSDACGRSSLSPRQLTTIRDCVTTDSACVEYLDCLGSAQRQ